MKISNHSLDMARTLLACGLHAAGNQQAPDGEIVETILYTQSHVREHTELAWILNCLTGIGQLFRMTQWKDKQQQQQQQSSSSTAVEKNTASLGLLSYPVLQAADILLFK